MHWVIDRFEGETAVCEHSDGSFVHFLRKDLPCGAREGSLLRLKSDGTFELDLAGEQARRARLFALQEGLFGGDFSANSEIS
ncbi:MAG: DUF3006 domain-containing protein [Oscillospiraceae bacterium]|jgi:hypothetical protein|nr:DUF3006 domain-containing protein [Oscillospiraceae bacterium]